MKTPAVEAARFNQANNTVSMEIVDLEAYRQRRDLQGRAIGAEGIFSAGLSDDTDDNPAIELGNNVAPVTPLFSGEADDDESHIWRSNNSISTDEDDSDDHIQRSNNRARQQAA